MGHCWIAPQRTSESGPCLIGMEKIRCCYHRPGKIRVQLLFFDFYEVLCHISGRWWILFMFFDFLSRIMFDEYINIYILSGLRYIKYTERSNS